MSSWLCSGGDGKQVGEETGQDVASVGAELKLGEVAPDVKAADRLVGSGDGGLQIAEHGVDPSERRDLFRLFRFA